MKAFVYHCLTCLYYLFGTVYYMGLVCIIVSGSWAILKGLVSFLMAPIGLKPDSPSAINEDFCWLVLGVTGSAWILFKIMKHVRINAQPALLPTRTADAKSTTSV